MDEHNKITDVKDTNTAVTVQPEINNTEPARVKKHHKWPWVVGILVFIFIVIPVLVIGWFGFMPGVSSLLGANKPVDLGVRYTAADFASYQSKTGGQFLDFANAPANPLKPDKKTVFADPKQMDVTLTQEEITATMNSTNWAWMPLTNAQMRFGDGNVVEISGNLNTGNILNFVNFIGGVGYNQSDINKALSWAKFAGNPAVYIKGTGSALNNEASISVQQVRIGRFNVPTGPAEKALSAGMNSIETKAAPYYYAQSATFSDGALHFVGTSPTTTYVKKN